MAISVPHSAILYNQATGVVLLDDGLRIVYLNEAAEALFNSSLKQNIGLPLDKLIEEDEATLIQACHKVMHGGGALRLRDFSITLPGTLNNQRLSCIVSYLDSAETDNQSVVPLIMLELAELEASGKITRDEEFVQRQQSNQAVIRGLAHEIRNPLGGIRGAAQLLAGESGSEAFAEYTRIIIREADRLTALVDRMQARTRVELDQSINIHRLLEHVRQLMLADGSPAFDIVLDYDPSLPLVRGNRDLLIQALLNVMRNAADAVESRGVEGCIRIRTRIDHLVIKARRQQMIRIDIIDNGPGVDASLSQRIFDPMVTGKANGTGLGLPITAEIVAQHKGALDFSSDPGATAFRLFLPVNSNQGDGQTERQRPGEKQLQDRQSEMPTVDASIYGVSI